MPNFDLIIMLSIGLGVGLPILIFVPILVGLMRNSATNRRLMQTGVSANARILQIWDTGVLINNQPQVGFLLEVRGADGIPFRSQAKFTVSHIHLAQFQPGALVEVKYDPANREQVVITGVRSLVNQPMFS